ncbi:MAG: hypothetical protein VB034_00995 [Eubacteriales bacterium]|nr:hypothetical protein [Eubacteriales bacterium]
MKRFTTDHILMLGMALTSDHRVMERRVRGVFARKKSAKATLLLALALVLALAAGGFTTACQPGNEAATSSNAATVSGGDALPASAGDAAEGDDDAFTKADAMKNLAFLLDMAREFPAPRMNGNAYTERGSWSVAANKPADEQTQAAEAFLKTANAIFETDYTAGDVSVTYYTDESGYRGDVWRIDSTDGTLSGAVTADTLAFLSADCLNEPSDRQHESISQVTTNDEGETRLGALDVTDAAERIAKILGGTAGEKKDLGGRGRSGRTGWTMEQIVLFPLGDGRYCTMCVFGDENLTPITVCVHPDNDCALEGVFWRADLEMARDVVALKDPQDFRKGEPGPDDMPVEQAYAFYYKLVKAAGPSYEGPDRKMKEPNATFYRDYSGARENYWHIEGEFATFDLTSKTGRMLNLSSNGEIGFNLGLLEIAYEQMGGQEYLDATRTFFAALYGEENITSVELNAVYDYHYCTVDPYLSDGTSYEIMYADGLIQEATLLVPAGEGSQRYVPNWLADWTYENKETGETFVQEW